MDPKVMGRGRYGKLGKKPPPQESSTSNRGRTSLQQQEAITIVPPPLTVINGPRPTYFTCRHGYEATLMDELSALTNRAQPLSMKEPRSDGDSQRALSTPTLGLVRLEDLFFETKQTTSTMDKETLLRASMQASLSNSSHFVDPVYALQTLPNCVVVSADSIKGLAQSIHDTLLEDKDKDVRTRLLREALRKAPRSSLAIHGLVPGMFKGQKKPMLERRVQTIVQELTTLLKKGYPAARPKSSTLSKKDNSPVVGEPGKNEASSSSSLSSDRWLLQVLLLTADVAVTSLVKCAALVPSNVETTIAGMSTPSVGSTLDEGLLLPEQPFYYWPNWYHPAGLAKVDISNEEMPSSAYRKLMEALECMRIRPARTTKNVYDLGACPGGWTWVFRHLLNCSVMAIDKSPLDPRLMSDPRIDFVKGDAFAFEPTDRRGGGNGEVWMVSDVIAYPDRILELLSKWCSGEWADYMIVTMKFHGNQPDFAAIQESMDLAKSHGYHCRAKHFFNNKNEVTLMVRRLGVSSPPQILEEGVLGTAMYPSSITPPER